MYRLYGNYKFCLKNSTILIINRIPFFYISLSTSKLFSYNIQIHHQNPLFFLSNYSCYLETFFFLFYYKKSCTSWKNGQRQIHTKWYFYNLLDSNVQHEYQHVNALYKIQNEKRISVIYCFVTCKPKMWFDVKKILNNMKHVNE